MQATPAMWRASGIASFVPAGNRRARENSHLATATSGPSRARSGGKTRSLPGLRPRLGLARWMQDGCRSRRGDHVNAFAQPVRRYPVNIQDIMSKPAVTCGPHDTLNTAAQLMWDHDCGAVPVVDDAGSLVGIVTDRDICMAAYTNGSALHAIPVSTAMAQVVFSCQLSDSLEAAEQVMSSNQIRRVPVVDGDNRPAQRRRALCRVDPQEERARPRGDPDAGRDLSAATARDPHAGNHPITRAAVGAELTPAQIIHADRKIFAVSSSSGLVLRANRRAGFGTRVATDADMRRIPHSRFVVTADENHATVFRVARRAQLP